MTHAPFHDPRLAVADGRSLKAQRAVIPIPAPLLGDIPRTATIKIHCMRFRLRPLLDFINSCNALRSFPIVVHF
jgi:hypothetical protein